MQGRVGRVMFFRKENCWGIITDPETNQEYHVHINDIVGRGYLERNEWVNFDVSDHDGRLSAINVVLIDCPPKYLYRGRVSKFVSDKLFGFISREGGDDLFFHISDVCLIDGVEYEPVEGCTVEFYEGVKANRLQAVRVKIVAWPEQSFDFEHYFKEAPELPLEYAPAPVAAPHSSVLSPATKHLSLIEIMNRRRKGKK
jgi:cold shock CspA family protein